MKLLFNIIKIAIILFAFYMAIMIITDYRPKDIMDLSIEKNATLHKISKGKVLSAITYNIGYCGIDKDQDVFIDGGHGAGSESKEKTLENLKGITDFLVKENPDFALVQEVDTKSKRSFNVNQYEYLKKSLKDSSAAFALNYKVLWIPYPFLRPYGYVNSGIGTFSRYNISEAKRYQYPGKEMLLKRIWFLDRCFLTSRVSVESGKELIVINTHCSAYDKGGKMKLEQMKYLSQFIDSEYKKGNYVLVGGDWNQLMPGTDPKLFNMTGDMPNWLKTVPKDFLPKGFKWVADPTTPSNRSDDAPYEKGNNYLSVIDGFLVSDNIEVKTIKTYPLEFRYTDHNPVKIEFLLK